MASKTRTDPRISVNKLAQYITSKAARQNQILRNAKYPPDYITAYYKEAGEAIALCLASGLDDLSTLEQRVAKLDQMQPNTVHQSRMIAANIDAIETFQGMLDQIDFLGSSPSLGAHTAPHLTLHGVGISVRPEVILRGEVKKGQPFIGGIKLHFPRTEPMNEEQAGYASALVHAFCRDRMCDHGTASLKHCFVIDLASQRAYPPAASYKKRITDATNACEQIAKLWPGT